MENIEEIRKGNKVLRIFRDENPESPREWDNLGKIAYKHKDYTIGEEEINEPIEWLEEKLNLNQKEVYTDDRLKELEEIFFKKFIALPLYLLDHSGLSISTTPFSCAWDSGKVGYIYLTKEKLKEEKLNKENALKCLEGEIKTLNQYLLGEVYGFNVIEEIKVKVIKKYPNGKIIETTETEEKDWFSCWGYFGNEGIKQIKEENNF